MSKIIIDISEDNAHDFMSLALGGNGIKTIDWTFIDTDGKTIDVEFVPYQYEDDYEEEE